MLRYLLPFVAVLKLNTRYMRASYLGKQVAEAYLACRETLKQHRLSARNQQEEAALSSHSSAASEAPLPSSQPEKSQ